MSVDKYFVSSSDIFERIAKQIQKLSMELLLIERCIIDKEVFKHDGDPRTSKPLQDLDRIIQTMVDLAFFLESVANEQDKGSFLNIRNAVLKVRLLNLSCAIMDIEPDQSNGANGDVDLF